MRLVITGLEYSGKTALTMKVVDLIEETTGICDGFLHVTAISIDHINDGRRSEVAVAVAVAVTMLS